MQKPRDPRCAETGHCAHCAQKYEAMCAARRKPRKKGPAAARAQERARHLAKVIEYTARLESTSDAKLRADLLYLRTCAQRRADRT